LYVPLFFAADPLKHFAEYLGAEVSTKMRRKQNISRPANQADPTATAITSNASRDIDPNTPHVFTGLINLGATCYMNVLLQCMYMNKAFRRGLYAFATEKHNELLKSPPGTKPDDADGIPLELALVFAQLQETSLPAVEPTRLTQSLMLRVGE
jgi:hypothetical protein